MNKIQEGHKTIMRERNYRMDNIRCFLIFCVAFGHLLELFKGDLGLYHAIYAFHMPAFIFITGYFAKFNSRKIAANFIYPYLLFQTLYIIFDAVVLNNGAQIELQYTTPYWLLWYLLTIIFYYLLIPMIESDNKNLRIIIFIGSAIISLLAGFDDSIGRYMSLSRFFTFLPFFVTGYYCGHRICKVDGRKKISAVIKICSLLIFITGIIFVIKSGLITSNMLYGASSYSKSEYSIYIKLLLMIIAAAGILCLLEFIPNRRLALISECGKYTYPVFLFHGFIVRLLKYYGVFKYSLPLNLFMAFVAAVCILTVFGNRWSMKIFNKVCTGNWLFRRSMNK